MKTIGSIVGVEPTTCYHCFKWYHAALPIKLYTPLLIVPPTGLEPVIFGLGNHCIIHYAMRAYATYIHIPVASNKQYSNEQSNYLKLLTKLIIV